MLSVKKLTSINFQTHAFQILTSQNLQGGLLLSITPGTVNNIIPNDIFQIEDNKIELKKFSYSKNSITYVKLKCATNGKSINTVNINVDNQIVEPQTPTPFGLPSSFEILIGIVYNSQIYQIVNSSLTVAGKVQYLESKNSATPGTLPFTVYLIWGY
jgi:hypothetical protein